MLKNFQGDSWGSIRPLRMPSLLPHDLCHGWSSSRWLPAVIEFQLSYSKSWKMMLWKVLHSICNLQYALSMQYAGSQQLPSPWNSLPGHKNLLIAPYLVTPFVMPLKQLFIQTKLFVFPQAYLAFSTSLPLYTLFQLPRKTFSLSDCYQMVCSGSSCSPVKTQKAGRVGGKESLLYFRCQQLRRRGGW